ncbi:MAG: FitA-like ribbon-helix-helix domain-containing protein [Actinomycetota bacterium]
MRQLITRVDEDLHRRLKERAAVERRSVNALVTELLTRALAGTDEPARVRARAEAAGLRVIPPPGLHPLSRDAAIAATRGAGSVASVALATERAGR